jgi:hypothetical protein
MLMKIMDANDDGGVMEVFAIRPLSADMAIRLRHVVAMMSPLHVEGWAESTSSEFQTFSLWKELDKIMGCTSNSLSSFTGSAAIHEGIVCRIPGSERDFAGAIRLKDGRMYFLFSETA